MIIVGSFRFTKVLKASEQHLPHPPYPQRPHKKMSNGPKAIAQTRNSSPRSQRLSLNIVLLCLPRATRKQTNNPINSFRPAGIGYSLSTSKNRTNHPHRRYPGWFIPVHGNVKKRTAVGFQHLLPRCPFPQVKQSGCFRQEPGSLSGRYWLVIGSSAWKRA